MLLSQISIHEKEVHKIVSWSNIYILFACIYFPRLFTQIIISVLTLAKKRDLVGIIYTTSLFFLYDGDLVYFYNIIVPHMELVQGQRINQIASQILFINGLLMYMESGSFQKFLHLYLFLNHVFIHLHINLNCWIDLFPMVNYNITPSSNGEDLKPHELLCCYHLEKKNKVKEWSFIFIHNLCAQWSININWFIKIFLIQFWSSNELSIKRAYSITVDSCASHTKVDIS